MQSAQSNNRSRWMIVLSLMVVCSANMTFGQSFSTSGIQGTTSGGIAGASCGGSQLTQNTNPNIVVAGSASCNAGGFGFVTTDNFYARNFPIAAPIFVKCIDFGVEANNAVGTTNVRVRLYTHPTSGTPVTANLTLISGSEMQVPVPANANLAFFTATYPGAGILVPAGNLVVELFTPCRQVTCTPPGDGGSIFIGSNAAGQSAPSYIKAPTCGLNDYATTASIGFPNMHLVIRLGTTLGGCGDRCGFSFGLPHTALGQAELQVKPDGDLVISNIGSSGNDGVRIGLGLITGPMGLMVFNEPPAPETSATFQATARGTLNGMADQVLATYSATQTAGNQVQFSADFSPLGVTGQTIRVYEDNVLVYEAANVASASVSANSWWECLLFGCPPDNWRPTWPFSTSFVVTTPGHTVTVIGDEVEFAGQNPANPSGGVAALENRAANFPDLVLTSEALVLFGHPHTALGNATMTGQGTELLIGNIGSSGNDGVAIDTAGQIPDGHSFVIYCPTLDANGAAPVGGFAEVRAVGILNGNPDQIVSRARYEVTGADTLLAQYDLSAITPESIAVSVFGLDDGQFLLAESIPTATFIGEIFGAISLTWSVNVGIPCCPSVDACGSFGAAYSSSTGKDVFSLPFGSYQVLFVAENPTQLVTDYSELRLTAGGGLSHLVITLEEVEPSVPCPGDINDTGAVNVDDLLAIINSWGQCSAPPTPCPTDIAPPGGNGVVNVDDLLAVIVHWGPCP